MAGLLKLPVPLSKVIALDEAVVAFLSAKRESLPTFTAIGAGELSCVIGSGTWAFKPLPPMEDLRRVEAYGSLLDAYVDGLRAAGVPVVDTSFAVVPSRGGYAGYIVQPWLPGEDLLSRRFPEASVSWQQATLSRILEHVDACVTAGIGIDPQLTNWIEVDGRPHLVDITTPMLRDATGRDRLDTAFFLRLLPVPVRWPVRRFMVKGLLDKNFDRRLILLDFVGSLSNYGMAAWTEEFLAAANRQLSKPLSMAEIRRYRIEDRATWKVLRRAFALEQWFRSRITRSPAMHLVPALLPRAVSD
jgi:hypothetical protein